MNNSELNALIRLLDDPDNTVFKIIENKLVTEGIRIVPNLEAAITQNSTKIMLQHTNSIIHQIQFNDIKDELLNWKDHDENLFQGAWLVSRYGYPNMQYNTIKNTFESIAQEINILNYSNFSPLEQIRFLNHLFYKKIKFISCQSTDYFRPENSYLAYNLENRIGNSISIAIIYLLLAQYCKIPVYGVNLPKNFMLAYISSSDKQSVFYINPFNQGIVLNQDTISLFLKQQNISPQSQFFNKCSNSVIIQRLLHILKTSYINYNKPQKAQEVDLLLKVFKHQLSTKIDWE